MKKKYLYLLISLFLLLGTTAHASPIIIGPYTFSGGEAAFADDATFISGDPVYIQHDPGEAWHNFLGNTTTDLDAALTGSDITLGIDGGGMNFDLLFTDNFIVNQAGADLVVFETISPENFDLAVYFSGSFTSFNTYMPLGTGYTVGQVVGTTNTGALNAIAIDLDDFGLSEGDYVSLLRIYSEPGGGSSPGTLNGADIVAVGALNSAPVPEPSTMLLLGAGLIGLFGLGRKKLLNRS